MTFGFSCADGPFSWEERNPVPLANSRAAQVKFALEAVTQKAKSNIFKGYLASFGNFDGYWSRRIGIEDVPSPSSEWVCFCDFAIIRHVIIHVRRWVRLCNFAVKLRILSPGPRRPFICVMNSIADCWRFGDSMFRPTRNAGE
jgi:hypothetical protein